VKRTIGRRARLGKGALKDGAKHGKALDAKKFL